MEADMVDVYIGEQIRELRRVRQVSLKELGSAIGTTYQQVQKYENAGNRVSASQLWRIAAHFDVSVDALFPRTDHDGSDPALIARLERLPPQLLTVIGDLADAIANAETPASAPNEGPVSEAH